MMFRVSVPIRGLLNLTDENGDEYLRIVYNKVSVPIRGLLNLTTDAENLTVSVTLECFRPHQVVMEFNLVYR